eukprot:scaffold302791_cov21-Tisochrysis_lutea.AAC.2
MTMWSSSAPSKTWTPWVCTLEGRWQEENPFYPSGKSVLGLRGKHPNSRQILLTGIQAASLWQAGLLLALQGPVIGGPVSKMPASGGTTSNRPVSSGLASSRPASGAPVRNGPAWVNLLVVGLQVAYSYTIVYYAFSSLHALAELRIPRAHVWGNQLGDCCPAMLGYRTRRCPKNCS